MAGVVVKKRTTKMEAQGMRFKHMKREKALANWQHAGAFTW
jgi:hypothetical protein